MNYPSHGLIAGIGNRVGGRGVEPFTVFFTVVFFLVPKAGKIGKYSFSKISQKSWKCVCPQKIEIVKKSAALRGSFFAKISRNQFSNLKAFFFCKNLDLFKKLTFF